MLRLLLFVLISTSSLSCFGYGLIRDAEIEGVIDDIYRELVEALPHKRSIKFYILNDQQSNAYNNGKDEIFITSGLIQNLQNYSALQSVIAHELGHNNQNHYAMQNMQFQDLAINKALVWGGMTAACMLLGGDPYKNLVASSVVADVYAGKAAMKFSREQERGADKYALDILAKGKLSCDGFIEAMRFFANMENILDSNQDAYWRSHPASAERVNFIQKHCSAIYPKNAKLDDQYIRARNKLIAFTAPLNQLKKMFKLGDDKESIYVWSIIELRQKNKNASIGHIDRLIAKSPNNPYLHELRGFILTVFGDIEGALVSYDKACGIAPGNSVLMIDRAINAINHSAHKYWQQIVADMQFVLSKNQQELMAWEVLYILYDKMGRKDLMLLTKAQMYEAIGDFVAAKENAVLVKQYAKKDSAECIKAKQIIDNIALSSKSR